jgi:hypothetical protein
MAADEDVDVTANWLDAPKIEYINIPAIVVFRRYAVLSGRYDFRCPANQPQYSADKTRRAGRSAVAQSLPSDDESAECDGNENK